MKVLATADSHLGYQQYGLKERKEDFMDAFEQVIDIAIEEKVETVVHAGDLFDKKNPGLSTIRNTLSLLKRLNEANIPFLGIEGNHDKQRATQWLDVFEELGLAYHVIDEPVEGVYGMDFMGRKDIEVPECDDGVEILLLHQFVEDDDIPVPSPELTLDELWGKAPIIVMGDYHSRKVWRKDNQLIMYTGSSERHSTRERNPRSVSIIDTETMEIEEIELDTRNFVKGSYQELKDSKAVEGAVVELEDRPDDLDLAEDKLLRNGAIKVLVKRGNQEDEVEDVDMEFESHHVADVVEQELPELSDTAQRVEEIIRDLDIADSNVDDEVQEVICN